MRTWVDPIAMVGRRLDDVVIGWHCLGRHQDPAGLWLRFDEQWVEVCTWGDGSLRFDLCDKPVDSDMAEFGRFEMRPPISADPLRPLMGWPVVRVRRITWDGTCVGFVLETSGSSVLLANEADEVLVSTGELPRDHVDAVIDE
ncbi:MAG: hypothetical protein AAF085_17355, partial [Planctomycetota bacterium]